MPVIKTPDAEAIKTANAVSQSFWKGKASKISKPQIKDNAYCQTEISVVKSCGYQKKNVNGITPAKIVTPKDMAADKYLSRKKAVLKEATNEIAAMIKQTKKDNPIIKK